MGGGGGDIQVQLKEQTLPKRAHPHKAQVLLWFLHKFSVSIQDVLKPVAF